MKKILRHIGWTFQKSRAKYTKPDDYQEQVERFQRLEHLAIPLGFNYDAVKGLSAEVHEKLKRVAPRTLGQAGRIPGVTPAAIAILAVLLRR